MTLPVTTTPKPPTTTSTPGIQESTSKPLGATPPAATTPPAPAVVPPAPAAPPAVAAPTEKPPEVAKKGKMQYVTSADEVDALLGDGGEANALMPRSSIKKIKDKFEERGRAAGQAELTKQLQAQGFGSIEEALLAASEAKRLREEAAKPPAPGAPGRKTASFLPPRGGAATPPATPPVVVPDAERRRTSEAGKERARADAAEAKLETERAEFALRTECMQADVLPDEVDYVLDKLRMHAGGMTDEQLATFDSTKWLHEMKQGKPYLFKSTMVPATTGVSSPNNVPPAPAPAAVAASATDENTTDARKMTPAEFKKHKEKLGVRRTY